VSDVIELSVESSGHVVGILVHGRLKMRKYEKIVRPCYLQNLTRGSF